jgi:hypothetical protein
VEDANSGSTAATITSAKAGSPIGDGWQSASAPSRQPLPAVAAAAPPSNLVGHAKNVLAAVGVLALIAQALRLAR